MKYLKYFLLIVCALINTRLQVVNYSFINIPNDTILAIINSSFYFLLMALLQFFAYIVLAKLYTKAYFYFFLYDSEIEGAEKQLFSSICWSYNVFSIAGIVLLVFSAKNPELYQFYIFGDNFDGRSINSFVMLIIAMIQAVIVFIHFYINALKNETNTNKFLRVIALCVILIIVHIPGVVHFGG